MPDAPQNPVPEPPQRRGMNVQLSGLLGVVLGIVVLVGIFSLLRHRLDNEPVDAPQLQLANDSPCMHAGLQALAKSGKPITYGELNALRRQCGENVD
jgi:hypothetical protein